MFEAQHPNPPSEGPVAASVDGEEVGETGPIADAHDVDILHVGLRDLRRNLTDQLEDELGVRRLARPPVNVPAAAVVLGYN